MLIRPELSRTTKSKTPCKYGGLHCAGTQWVTVIKLRNRQMTTAVTQLCELMVTKYVRPTINKVTYTHTGGTHNSYHRQQ